MQQSTEMTSPATKCIKETFLSAFITSCVSVHAYIFKLFNICLHGGCCPSNKTGLSYSKCICR